MNKKKQQKMAMVMHILDGDSLEYEWIKEGQELAIKVKRDGKYVSAEKIESFTYYERPKKPKYLNKLEFKRSSEFSVCPVEALRHYDSVWAIDTNKREVFGETANVSGVMLCHTYDSSKFEPLLSIIFGQTKNNPELLGWRKFIELICSTEGYNKNKRFVLIVDSEFSMLSKFNSKQSPIHGNFYLPENWSLIYATSDTGKASYLNKVISEADKLSTRILNSISNKQTNAVFWKPISDENTCTPYVLLLKKP